MTTEDTRSAYEQKWMAQLEEWEAEIDKLSARAEKADAETRIELNEKLETLADKQRKARAHIEDLRETGEEAWREMWDRLEHTRGDITGALQALKKKLS